MEYTYIDLHSVAVCQKIPNSVGRNDNFRAKSSTENGVYRYDQKYR